MNFMQRNKIALKVYHKLCVELEHNDICLSNDVIIIDGDAIYFDEILKYYNRLKNVKYYGSIKSLKR